MKRPYLIALALCLLAPAASAQWLPTGQTVTPLAPAGARFDPLALELPVIGHAVAGQAVTTALTPDGRTLLVLTSGYNSWRDAHGKIIPEASTEHLFVFDVSSGTPAFRQALPVPNAFGGLAISSDGNTAYVTPDGRTLLVLTSGYNSWRDAH